MNNQDLPADWKSTLRHCNFELAREELKNFFEIANVEAAECGKEVFYPAEFLDGWHRFAESPRFETAVTFIEGAPECAHGVFTYFLECRPGGRFAFYSSVVPSDE